MKKIISIICMLIILISTINITLNDSVAEGAPPAQMPSKGKNVVGLDWEFIKSFTEILSNIITEEYNPATEIPKGRWFGSDGELKAKDRIIQYLQTWGITTDEDNIMTNSLFQRFHNSVDIQSFLEITNDPDKYSFSIHNTVTQTDTDLEISEFFISPKWDDGEFNLIHQHRVGKPYANQLYDLINYEDLSQTVEINDAKIYPRPLEFMESIYLILTEYSGPIMDFLKSKRAIGAIIALFAGLLEYHYGFDFEEVMLYEDEAKKLPWYNSTIANNGYDFLFVGEDPAFNPYKSSYEHWFTDLDYGLGLIKKFAMHLEMWMWKAMYRDHCKGLVLHDNIYNQDNETHNMVYNKHYRYPIFYVDYNTGSDLLTNRANYELNIEFEQIWNDSVTSNNVIGEIEGTSNKKSVLLTCLYDGWWSQATCDSAIGMSIVMAIAKYARNLETQYGIIPKYDLKFIAFGGEEAGLRGAYDYEKRYRNLDEEKYLQIIDLNQLGYDQKWPPQTLYCIFNHDDEVVEKTLNEITEKSHYTERTDGLTQLEVIDTKRRFEKLDGGWNALSDYTPFDIRDRLIRYEAKTICFLKENSTRPRACWRQHHRTGKDYTTGDSMTLYNESFVNVTAEIVWNMTKYWAYEPDCWFVDGSKSVVVGDTNDDGYNDFVNISFDIDTIMPHERATVFVRLWTDQRPSPYQRTKNYIVDRDGIQKYINITIQDTWTKGNYLLYVYLFNSTGEIDNEVNNGANINPFKLWYYSNDSFFDSKTGFQGQNTNPNINVLTSQDATVNAGVQTIYTTGGSDPDGDQVYYQMQYTNTATGSTEYTGWYGPYTSGVNQSITKTWTVPGSYNVQVRSRDDNYAPNVYSNWSDPFNVTVNESIYYIAPEKHVVNTTLNVTGIAYGVNATSWEWMFDDQSERTDNYTQSAEHSYSLKQTYTINLTVEDNQSTNYFFDHEIEIVPLLTSFLASDETVKPNETITFNSTYIGEAAVDGSSWNWTFGDGNTSTTRNTTHNYTTTGTYNVTLTVKDVQNRSTNYTKKVYVDHDTPGFVSIAHTPEQYTTEDITTGFYPLKFSKDQNLSLFADFYDTGTSVTNVSVNITYPDGTTTNITMDTNTTDPSDFTYLFTNADQIGYYTYTIWAKDAAGHLNKTTNTNFFEVCHNFGTTNIQLYNTTIEDTILGTNFTIKEDGTADSITVYLKSNETPPTKVKCMIYQGTTLIGTTEEKNVSTGDIFEWISFNFTGTELALTKDTNYILSCWSDKPCYISYDNTSTTIIGYHNLSTYGTPDNPITWEGGSPPPDEKYRTYSIYCSYSNLPEINNVSHTPGTVGFGYNVTVTADIIDSSGLETVAISMDYPNASLSWENNTMTNTNNDTYQFIFDDSWLVGQYNYTIYATDTFGNKNKSAEYSFNVTGNATISICTIFDSYQNGTIINLTDPPPTGPSDIGYALNNSGNILHIWNTYDNYYFNTSSGIQLTNHKDDHWSHNVLMLGYYNNDQWNLIYRTDELSGFSKEIDTDNETYVNATLWKDLSYQDYDFRLAIRYHLGINDTDLTIIPYIKNIDNEDILYTLGFGWELKDIQIAMTTEDDWLDINQTSYLLHPTDNSSINQTYTDLDQSIIYIKEYTSNNTVEDLYLTWDSNLTYKVQVKSRENQYNAPVTLFIRIGSLDSGEEKQTEMQWHDGLGSETTETYYFDAYMKLKIWSSYPSYMVDGNENTAATTSTNNDIQDCNSNTGDGDDLGVIEKVEIRALGKYATRQTDIILTPEFGGTSAGDDHTFQTTSTKAWSGYFDITSDTNAPGTWDWDDVNDLDCEVKAVPSGEGSFTAYCYKVEVRVTYEEYVAPTVTLPVPSDNETNVTPPPELQVTVDDGNGDTLTAYWYSNSSGSWALFATNTSISTASGEQTIKQTNTNFSNFSTSYYWSVNVTDVRDWTNNTYKFKTGAPNSTINPISPYQQTTSQLNVTATGAASIDNITLYYRYSQDNNTWIGPWWNSSWGYFKTCQINNPLDDYQMKIIVGNSTGGDVICEGYAQPDFDDIRFLRTDNSTELPYWRENYTADTQATFWVNNLYNDSIILMYYGNDEVTTSSNGTATFIMFDDFSSDTDSNWYQYSYSQGYYYIRPIGQSLSAARLRWQARCNDQNSRNWAGASFVGFTDINSSSCKTENYTAIRSSYNTDNGASETQPSFRFYTKQDGTGEDNGAYEKEITEGNNYTWDLRFSPTSAKVDVWDSSGTSKYSKSLSSYPPTSVSYQFIQHHDYHGDGSCTEEELTWYNSTPSYLRSYCRGSHYGCDSHVEYWNYWMFIANYSSTESTWNSFSAPQTRGWKIWDNTSNPDTGSPWQWNFDYPDGRGYYEFYSIAQANSVTETRPVTADARCRYGNQSKLHNTGSYDIMGYLYMDVQKYNSTSGNWTSAITCLSDGSPRNLSSLGINKTIAFDTLFNGLLNSSVLWYYGNGTYRFYVAFTDPESNVLITDDERELYATHEFTVTYD
jgi:hypothetical protein